MNVRDILIAAKALIPDEEHWWRGPDSKRYEPSCECPVTAVEVCSLSEKPYEAGSLTGALNAFCKAIGGLEMGEWNDAPERTLAEVHAAFDRAIELAGKVS